MATRAGGSWSPCSHSQEAERNQCCCEPVFLFIQPGTAAQGTVAFCITAIPELCVCDDPNSCHLTAKMTHHGYFCAEHHTSFLPKITFFGHRESHCVDQASLKLRKIHLTLPSATELPRCASFTPAFQKRLSKYEA